MFYYSFLTEDKAKTSFTTNFLFVFQWIYIKPFAFRNNEILFQEGLFFTLLSLFGRKICQCQICLCDIYVLNKKNIINWSIHCNRKIKSYNASETTCLPVLFTFSCYMYINGFIFLGFIIKIDSCLCFLCIPRSGTSSVLIYRVLMYIKIWVVLQKRNM